MLWRVGCFLIDFLAFIPADVFFGMVTIPFGSVDGYRVPKSIDRLT
jgi:hypothetical protein